MAGAPFRLSMERNAAPPLPAARVRLSLAAPETAAARSIACPCRTLTGTMRWRSLQVESIVVLGHGSVPRNQAKRCAGLQTWAPHAKGGGPYQHLISRRCLAQPTSGAVKL